MCPVQGKLRFKRKSLAVNYLLKMRQRSDFHAGHMNIYQCICCDDWHYGHAPGMRTWLRLPRKSA
jgi:hypothetical protein